MTKPYDNLVVAAVKLTAHAQAWEEFLVAMRDYKQEALVLMMQAPPDRLQTLQGRAHGLSDLLNILETCRDRAKSLTEKKDGG